MSTVFCRFFCYSCIQNGKGIRYLSKQGGAAGLGLLLGILQNGDGIARSIRRVKTGKPVMQQLPAVCIKLAGLSRAGFTGGGTGLGLGIAGELEPYSFDTDQEEQARRKIEAEGSI